MPIITIFRIVDINAPFDYYKGQIQFHQNNIHMRLEREDPIIDPEILDKPGNPWRTAYELEWDDEIGEFVNDFNRQERENEHRQEYIDFNEDWDDEIIIANVINNAPEIVFKSDKEQSDTLFEDIAEGIENSNIYDIYKLIQTVGRGNMHGYTHYPCLNCLAYGWNGGDELGQYRAGRCCQACNNQPAINLVHEDILVKGTWTWDETVERDEKYEQERLFDMVVDALNTCCETEFTSVLDNCGTDNGFPCLTCLQTKCDLLDSCVGCSDRHLFGIPNYSELLICGTWLWSTAMTRDDDDCTCSKCVENIDAGLNDRDYYSEDYDY